MAVFISVYILASAAALVGAVLGAVITRLVLACSGVTAVVSQDCADAYVTFGKAATTLVTPPKGGSDVQRQALADAHDAVRVIEFLAPGATATAVVQAMAALEHLVTVWSSPVAEEARGAAVRALDAARDQIRGDLGANSGRVGARAATLLRHERAGASAVPG